MDNSSAMFDESKWVSFKKNLKKNVGDTAFNNWLKHLSLKNKLGFEYFEGIFFRRLLKNKLW